MDNHKAYKTLHCSKMTVNTSLSTTESKKQTKQTKRTETKIMDMESILMFARWEGCGGGEWVKR